MSGFVGYVAPTASTKIRKVETHTEWDLGGTLLATLGTENIEYYIGGTPIGKVTASGKYRPCGKTRVKTAGAALTTVEVDSALNFYVGDVVEFYDLATGALIATKTLTVVTKTGVTHDIRFAGAINVGVDDIVLLNNGAQTAIGILETNVQIYRYPPAEYRECEGHFIRSGIVYDSLCRGVGDLIKADLPCVFFD